MIGLIDCNNFFVSCERVFNPALRNKPVIVLSNNDGCAVALSNEAKKIGLKRGDPYFQIRDIIERHNVSVLSGNHKLYGDMSSRVMATISGIIPEVEVYSVDECFIRFDLWPVDDLLECGRDIVQKVRRHTGIPTSLGIAPTKTLAKIAARFAKKFPAYKSVCIIDDETKRRKALGLTPVEDVWGIGRRLSKKLHAAGIHTALQLADSNLDTIRSLVNIVGQRTWRELNGHPCIELDLTSPDKKQICCSRSFANMIFEPEPLFEAIAAFTAIASRKLREQNSATSTVGVFVHTNVHRPDLDQYHASTFTKLAEPSADVMTITAGAVSALREIYKKGYGFKKAGVILTDILPAGRIQPSLFIPVQQRQKRNKLMNVMDHINAASHTHDTLRLAAQSTLDYHVKCQLRSRLYTTRMSDIITINA